MYWILGRCFKLSLNNKLVLYILYKRVLKFGSVQLREMHQGKLERNYSAFSKQRTQVHRCSPWYIGNPQGLTIALAAKEVQRFAKKREQRLHKHLNVEMLILCDGWTELNRLSWSRRNLFTLT